VQGMLLLQHAEHTEQASVHLPHANLHYVHYRTAQLYHLTMCKVGSLL